jgi:hypothetical protein
LPDTPASDLWVEDNALAMGTHGRSFYVMDNLATLRQYDVNQTSSDVKLYAPARALRGQDRATIDYYLKTPPKSLTLEFIDAKGAVVRAFTGQPPRTENAGSAAQGGGEGGPPGPQTTVSMTAGMNRASWDLNSTPVVSFPGMILWGATTNGPMVLPGTYQVKLTVDGVAQTATLQVVKHPLRDISDADLLTQWDLASRIRDKVNEANASVIRIRRIKTDVAARAKDAPKEVQNAADQLAKALGVVEEDIYQVRNQSGQDPLNFPIKTNNRLASLLRVAVTGEGRPTGNVESIFKDLVAELQAETDRLNKTLADQLPPFNRMLQRIKREPVSDR